MKFNERFSMLSQSSNLQRISKAPVSTTNEWKVKKAAKTTIESV